MCNFEQSSISAGLLKDTTYQEKGKSIYMLSFFSLPFFSRTQKWISWRSVSNLSIISTNSLCCAIAKTNGSLLVEGAISLYAAQALQYQN